MYLSVTCAEDLPWIKPRQGERVGEHTFLGSYRLVQQREACAEWPRGNVPKDFDAPVRSNVPVLMLTGRWDPATPAASAAKASQTLPNSLSLIIPSGGHGFNGLDHLDCIEKLSLDLIETGSAKTLDTSCVSTIRRKGFQLKF